MTEKSWSMDQRPSRVLIQKEEHRGPCTSSGPIVGRCFDILVHLNVCSSLQPRVGRTSKLKHQLNWNIILYIVWIITSYWTLFNLQRKCGTKCKWQMFLMVDLNKRPNPTVWHLEMFPVFPNRNRSGCWSSVLCLTARRGHGTRTTHMFFGTTWRNRFGATKKDHWGHSRRIILNPFSSDRLLHSGFISRFTPGRKRKKKKKKTPVTSVGGKHQS